MNLIRKDCVSFYKKEFNTSMTDVYNSINNTTCCCIDTFVMLSKSTKNFDCCDTKTDDLDINAQNGLFYTFSYAMNTVNLFF